MERIQFLGKDSFELSDIYKAKFFNLGVEIINLYARKYVFEIPVKSFYISYDGSPDGEPSFSIFVNSLSDEEYKKLPRYSKDYRLIYDAIIRTMVVEKAVFSDIWRNLAAALKSDNGKMTDLETLNLLFSDYEKNLLIILSYLVQRKINKKYAVFDLDTVYEGTQL